MMEEEEVAKLAEKASGVETRKATFSTYSEFPAESPLLTRVTTVTTVTTMYILYK